MEQTTLQCQSCGMPLTGTDVQGTDASGGFVEDYCIYCYENGAFTQPEFKVEDMIEFCVPFLVEQGMEEKAARGILAGSLPGLKRWATEADEPVFAIVNLEPFQLVGIGERTTNAAEMSGQGKIGALWERFWSGDVQSALSGAALEGDSRIYGCYADYVDGAAGEYTILIGRRAEPSPELPEGLASVDVPAAKYAVFTTRRGPIGTVVLEAWQRIWRWASSSAGPERAYTGDFELYDERSANPEDAVVDIYIAVK